MKKSKQVLSILLAVLMLALSVPFAAADDVVEIGGQCGENVFWKLDDQGKLTIFGEGEMALYYTVGENEDGETLVKDYPHFRSYFKQISSVVIQDGVTSIAPNAFAWCENLKDITIPNTVTKIENFAFEGCTLLEDVAIPISVKTIGEEAFLNCCSLISVTIPSRVVSIGHGAFESCKGLRYFNVAADNQYYTAENGILFNKEKTILIQCPGTKTKVVIPSGVIGIDYCAFAGCRSLVNVTMPNSLTIIGNAAFEGCSKLKEITIPDSVINLGWSAFYDCDSLTSISIPVGLTNIGDRAFDCCDSLQSIDVAKENPAYSSFDGALYNKDKTVLIRCPGAKAELLVFDGVTSLTERSVFSNCDSLTQITIPKSVTEIEAFTFDGCSSLLFIDVDKDNPAYSSVNGVLYNKTKTVLAFCPNGKTEISIPSSVRTIGYSAFKNCSELKNVSIPNSIIKIYSGAFYGCGLTSVTIPGTVLSIGDSAFYDCANLESVVIENGVETIEQWAFRGCTSLASITIPESVIEIGGFAFGECERLESILVSTDNPAFSSLDGILYNKDQTKLLQCPTAKRHVDIPNTVNAIGYQAFRGCNNLTSLVIPNSVTIIDSWAFSECVNLFGIVLSNSLTTVKSGAFAYCYNLRSATLSEGMKTIPSKMFDGCGLISVTLPKSIKRIGDQAFSYCVDLKDVYFTGNESEWNQIVVETDEEGRESNGPLFSATVHFNWIKVTEDTVTEVSVSCSVNAFNNNDVSLQVSAIDMQNENARAWRITPVDTAGNKVQPNQSVQLRLPLPAGWSHKPLLITHIQDDGRTEIITDYVVDGNYVSFWVSGFSQFTVSTKEETKHEHTFNSTVTMPATCTDSGIRTYVCACGDTYDETIAAIDHTYTETVTTAATCTATGEVIYTCYCGDTDAKPIPALGHVDDDNDGYCDRCEQQMEGGDHCKYCGKIHNGGFFDKLTGFIHKIFAIFKR